MSKPAEESILQVIETITTHLGWFGLNKLIHQLFVCFFFYLIIFLTFLYFLRVLTFPANIRTNGRKFTFLNEMGSDLKSPRPTLTRRHRRTLSFRTFSALRGLQSNPTHARTS